MRRIFTEDLRDRLDERLRVWHGPLPEDLGKRPEVLLDVCQDVGAGTLVIDSIKDLAVKITDDEVGGNINRAMQLVVAEGINLVASHHQRKGQGGQRPRTIEDVYGSTWLTAGAGSVVLLWGSAGDPIVELVHLKQPAGEVGPLKIEHDHLTGRSSVFRGVVDPLVVLSNSPAGITAVDLARLSMEREPSDNERKKAQRVLDRLVRDGRAHRNDGSRGGAGGTTAARYHAVERHLKAIPDDPE